MNTETSAAPMRKRGMAITPMRLDAVYDDPELLIDWIKSTAPHRNVYDAEGYEQGESTPFFRAYWCSSPGVPAEEGLRQFVYNPNFIEGAKKAYDVKVVRPLRILVNFNVPGPAQPGHMDVPTFRGLDGQPTWHASVMGVSKLFVDWDVQIASGLCWFYGGEGGDFRFWPNGKDKPAQIECGPFWNQGLISDNEYTFHQAGKVGAPEDYLDRGAAGKECSLHWIDDQWQVIRDTDGEKVASYNFEDVRILTLWKALVFKDEAEAAVYDEHKDDLDIDKATRIFAEDLKARGIAFDYPEDPMTDLVWRKVLFDSYTEADLPTDLEPIGI